MEKIPVWVELTEKVATEMIMRNQVIEPGTDIYGELIFLAWLEPERYQALMGIGLREILAVPIEEFREGPDLAG